ncbi:MAG: AGE family epimerase/isomerase [Cyclobacteriaceae bacterium]|nr:AGE family epimerase/isomerase [Cyclobacteriaceae bacterium]
MMTDLQDYKKELEEELSSILQYWINNTIDHQHGGFYGQINQENQVSPEAEKGAVLNARILWTFAAAYNFTRDKKYLQVADRAFEYIKTFFFDREFGGLYWVLSNLGIPINTRKQIYAQGFGIYGFSEYFKATGNKESLAMAQALFECIEKYSYDEVNGGYLEALSREWKPMEDMRLSNKDANYPKSMNTHLHILEPYTNLYRVWPDQRLYLQIKRLIRVFLDRIIDGKTAHFNLFFERDWTVKSDIVSFGHDIEGAWLLTEAAETLGDKELLEEVEKMALRMADATLAEGAAGDGSIYYEKVAGSGHLDKDRHWWPQAEAMVGFADAWRITGEQKYLQKSMDAWQFIKSKLIDRQHGEWFWKVNERGDPSETEDKAGFWKCPYHNSRACMEVMRRLGD